MQRRGKRHWALDGWYGVDFEKKALRTGNGTEGNGTRGAAAGCAGLYKTRGETAAYNAQYVTGGSGFGIECEKGLSRMFWNRRAMSHGGKLSLKRQSKLINRRVSGSYAAHRCKMLCGQHAPEGAMG